MCVQREGLLGAACVCDIKCEVVGVQSALLDLLALGKRRPIESRLPLLSLLVPSLLLLCMQVRARVHDVKLGLTSTASRRTNAISFSVFDLEGQRCMHIDV